MIESVQLELASIYTWGETRVGDGIDSGIQMVMHCMAVAKLNSDNHFLLLQYNDHCWMSTQKGRLTLLTIEHRRREPE